MSDPVYRSQVTEEGVLVQKPGWPAHDGQRTFKQFLYMLGRDDEETGILHRFNPCPDWLQPQELNCYNAGRTDQRLGQT